MHRVSSQAQLLVDSPCFEFVPSRTLDRELTLLWKEILLLLQESIIKMSSTKSPSLSCSNSVTDDNNGADQIDFSGVIDPALLALSHPTHNNNRSANDDDPTSLFVEDTESNQSSIDNLPADDDYDDAYDDDYDNDYDNDYDDTSSDFPKTETNQSSTNNFPADADDEEADNSIEESDDDGIPVKKRKISGK